MDVRVRERLVGALVLVAIVVLLVPAILTGPQRPAETPVAAPVQSVEVALDTADPSAKDEVLVPEPTPATSPATDSGASPHAAASDPARPAAAQPPAADPAATAAWAVQLGAFSTRDKADRLVADLRKRGYAAFVLEYRASGQVLHRVRVGPEQDRARAVAIAERLRKDGFQPVVAPHP